MTVGCFPAPIQGELLYGVLARHRLLSGARTAADHAMELFGRRAAIASFGLPCRLDALAARLPAAAGLDGAGLLAHTLYPFYAAFQTLETREAVAADLRSSEASNAHHRLGVAAFRVRTGDALRYCRSCLDEQVRTLGVGTWLVAHQLPGVAVCAEHGVRLADSGVTRATAGRHGYVTPDEANCAHECEGPDGKAGAAFSGAALTRLWSLSRAALSLSLSLVPAQAMDHWRGHYVERLRAVGLMRSAMKVDQAALNDGLRAFWGPALPHLPSACSAFGETGWAAAMVRTHRKAMHPLFHLMMDGFLQHLEEGGEVPALDLGDIAATVPMEGGDAGSAARPVLPVSGSGRAPRVDWVALDDRLCGDIRAAETVIRALEPPVRVTVAEIERRVVRTDWFGKRRRKVPKAVAMLQGLEEPVAAYRRRRAEHWILALGPSCRPWEVMRAAGLRSEHLPMIRAAMATRAASDGR